MSAHRRRAPLVGFPTKEFREFLWVAFPPSMVEAT